MTLIEELKAYVKGKGSSKHDKVKSDFFKFIIRLHEQNQLTIASLTDTIEEFALEGLDDLFWLGRSGKASNQSQAAQLLGKIYRELGIPMDDKILASIVNDGITKYKKELENYTYRHWQKNSLSKRAQVALDRELKGLLNFVNADDRGKSLVECLSYAYENNRGSLKANLAILADKVPDYLPQVLSGLVNLIAAHPRHNGENEVELALIVGISEDTLIEDLVELITDKPQLFKLVSESDPRIGTALIYALIQEDNANAKLFFDLSPDMQKAVQTQLHKQGDMESLDGIKSILFQNPLMRSLLGENLDDAHSEFLTRLQNKTFKNLESIENVILPNLLPGKEELIANHQIAPAIEAIDAYLEKNPNAYKYKFFISLKEAIEAGGLTTAIMDQHLRTADPKLLFEKWSGANNSRAMDLIFELYKIANFISPEEEANIPKNRFNPSTGTLVEIDDLDARKNTFLKKKIKQIFRNPQSSNSSLEESIAKMVKTYETYASFLQREDAILQSQVEANFQNKIIEKALEKVGNGAGGIFDPQGHLIVAIDLEQADYDEIMQAFPAEKRTKENLELVLGKKITKTTLCNLDIGQLGNNDLITEFKNRVDPSHGLDAVLDRFLLSNDRSSVIALQEEMMMHIFLSLRGLEKAAAGELLNPAQRQALMLEINGAVLNKFAEILRKVKNDVNDIDYISLNEHLDNAREELAPQCRALLVKHIANAHADNFEALNTTIVTYFNAHHEHAFTGTTATGWDYLRTDISNQTVTHISATEKTAHDKKEGPLEQATRLVSRCHYHPNLGVSASMDLTTEMRVPSIAQNAGRHSNAVKDVAAKLRVDVEKLREKSGHYRGPIIYNLLTSLHTKAYDNSFFERANKQRASAARILKGSHLFNLEQMRIGEVNALVYVQNIPVNQHTNELDYDAFDGATSEAALMVDMALLATLNQHAAIFPPQIRQSIKTTFASAHTQYLKFLPQAQDGDHYFKDSQQGLQTRKDLKMKKEQWKVIEPMHPSNHLPTLAVQSLFKMMANNHHENKQFGMLSQALSVFVEEMSLAGCKSANERYQAVSGRVGLLKAITQQRLPLTPEKEAVITSLKNYVAGTGTVAEVQASLDKAYNKHYLQNAVAEISEEDQGASSKVNATSNKKERGVITEFDTNYAESGYLTRLFQKCSSAMQAHKAGLVKIFTELFSGKAQELNQERQRTNLRTA